MLEQALIDQAIGGCWKATLILTDRFMKMIQEAPYAHYYYMGAENIIYKIKDTKFV
jgi:hypothetical protein